jgi:hypothetical protein
MLWLMLTAWLLLAPLVALLVGRALTVWQHNEDRMIANSLWRADSEGHGATGDRDPTPCRLRDRNRQRATRHRVRSRT